MKITPLLACLACLASIQVPTVSAENLQINEKDYFEKQGLNVMVFNDIYPDGHQTGVSIIQHGLRVAANGDLRLEVSPGQWSPVPAGGDIKVDKASQTISQTLSYPDDKKNKKGFNPIDYPDFKFSYNVNVTALKGNSFKVSVDLEKPLPSEWVGKVGFNFELFPGHLFGKGWLMDDSSGIFPVQPNGPILKDNGEWLAGALAAGKKLVVAPGEDKQRIVFEARKGTLELWDGRANHNNGWYIIRSLIPAAATKNAIEWVITPNTVNNWMYEPVMQVSQLGYATAQEKRIIIEQDAKDKKQSNVTLYKLTEHGRKKVVSGKPKKWGKFLRYNYLTYDFSDIQKPGMYVAEYRGKLSHSFKVGDDVFARHVWQPTLEYYLPVQMCHMRVNEKYRVWHGLCHHDDALMSPVNTNHFDGYKSGPSTLTKFKPMEPVPNLNSGGWHDAGDYDLRVESQMSTVWLLSMMIEEFGLNYDATLIDQEKQLVEIHEPDGESDALQQIEHGLLSVLGAYQSMGRLYRGIIVPTKRQYVLLGDGSVQTDNVIHDGKSKNPDDRWVFTENNPNRELRAVAGLAAASRVLKDYNPKLAALAITAARDVYEKATDVNNSASKNIQANNRAFALAELMLATNDASYENALVAMQSELVEKIDQTGWAIGRAASKISNQAFTQAISSAVEAYQAKVSKEAKETPYGVPYKPYIWGAGWGIQSFGVRQYFFRKSWPQFTKPDVVVNALNFVLGVHPGENTMSFASGVGANSALVAYGVNRGDWSFIPGGVISGTALIRPDLPELKIWPFFWQQTEYVMGGGATNFMFLALAVNDLYSSQ